MDYRKQALEYLGQPDATVLKFTLLADTVRLVLDKGIKGCPSYVIPLENLQPAGVDVVALEADAAPETAARWELNATRAAEQALADAGLTDAAAAHFHGERVTKAAADEYIEEHRHDQ